jgi:hypothetical protein
VVLRCVELMVVSRPMVLRLLRSRLKSGEYLRECDPSRVGA